MSAFKKLNRQDVFLTSHYSKKSWEVSSSIFENYEIQNEVGIQGQLPLISGSVDYRKRIVYESIKHLYYSNISGSVISGSYENYFQSSLYNDTRNLEEKVFYISIPQNITGKNLEPSTIFLEFSKTGDYGIIKDNGEGKLFLSGSNISIQNEYVGDCIYTHGMLVVTNTTLVDILDNSSKTLRWKSNLPIITSHVYCTVRDYELNFTQNPSAITGSNNQFRDSITGSYFQPYITGIGLYNDANELIAVGKFGQAIPKTPHTDMTFVIKLDM
jgi:hypothetical protein